MSSIRFWSDNHRFYLPNFSDGRPAASDTRHLRAARWSSARSVHSRHVLPLSEQACAFHLYRVFSNAKIVQNAGANAYSTDVITRWHSSWICCALFSSFQLRSLVVNTREAGWHTRNEARDER